MNNKKVNDEIKQYMLTMLITALNYNSEITELAAKTYTLANMDVKLSIYKKVFESFDDIHKKYREYNEKITKDMKDFYETIR